jgi:hypothetical protein
MRMGAQALSMALFTRYAAMTKEEVDGNLYHVKEEIRDANIHAYFYM